MATDASAAPSRWPWFITGVFVFILGLVLTGVQFGVGLLTTPWQAPILATLGVLCMFLSVVQRGGILRILGFVVFTLLTGSFWFLMLVVLKSPDYTGPQVGAKLPSFSGTRADGTMITQADFADGKPSIMLFFRGKW